jgi:predicted transcriptional regulator
MNKFEALQRSKGNEVAFADSLVEALREEYPTLKMKAIGEITAYCLDNKNVDIKVGAIDRFYEIREVIDSIISNF